MLANKEYITNKIVYHLEKKDLFFPRKITKTNLNIELIRRGTTQTVTLATWDVRQDYYTMFLSWLQMAVLSPEFIIGLLNISLGVSGCAVSHITWHSHLSLGYRERLVLFMFTDCPTSRESHDWLVYKVTQMFSVNLLSINIPAFKVPNARNK